MRYYIVGNIPGIYHGYLTSTDSRWQDKWKLIAQSVDNLGDQFRPAMRAGWLSYIRRAYPEDAADDAGRPAVGEGIFVVPE